MIDFHTHILPCIDDGSVSVAMSKEMLACYDSSVTDIALTPHFYPWRDHLDLFLKRRAQAYQALQQELPQQMPFRFHLGAEVAYFDGIRHSEDILQFLLGDTRLLLVELPMAQWKESIFDNLLYAADKRDFIPVLAHIDRYRLRSADWRLVEFFVRNGGKVQLNTSAFSMSIAKKAKQWIKKGLIHFIGSDCHNLTDRAPNLSQTLARWHSERESELLHTLQAESDRYFSK